MNYMGDVMLEQESLMLCKVTGFTQVGVRCW